MNKIKDKFDSSQTIYLKIDDKYKLVSDVLAVNCDIPSQSELKDGLTYVKLSCGFITFDGKLKEIEILGNKGLKKMEERYKGNIRSLRKEVVEFREENEQLKEIFKFIHNKLKIAENINEDGTINNEMKWYKDIDNRFT